MEICTQILDESFLANNDVPDIGRVKVGSLKISGIPYDIFQGDNVIGRDELSDIVIRSSTISGKHAVIEVEDWDTHLLYDCGSSNKTRLGKMILKPNVRYCLRGMDDLMFADIKATYIKLERPQTVQLEDSDSDTGSESMLNCDHANPANYGDKNEPKLLVNNISNSEIKSTNAGDKSGNITALSVDLEGSSVYEEKNNAAGHTYVDATVDESTDDEDDFIKPSQTVKEFQSNEQESNNQIGTISFSQMLTEDVPDLENIPINQNNKIVKKSDIVPDNLHALFSKEVVLQTPYVKDMDVSESFFRAETEDVGCDGLVHQPATISVQQNRRSTDLFEVETKITEDKNVQHQETTEASTYKKNPNEGMYNKFDTTSNANKNNNQVDLKSDELEMSELVLSNALTEANTSMQTSTKTLTDVLSLENEQQRSFNKDCCSIITDLSKEVERVDGKNLVGTPSHIKVNCVENKQNLIEDEAEDASILDNEPTQVNINQQENVTEDLKDYISDVLTEKNIGLNCTANQQSDIKKCTSVDNQDNINENREMKDGEDLVDLDNALTQVNEALPSKSSYVTPSRKKHSQTTDFVPVSPNALTQVNDVLPDKLSDVTPSRRKQSQTIGVSPVSPNALTQINEALLGESLDVTPSKRKQFQTTEFVTVSPNALTQVNDMLPDKSPDVTSSKRKHSHTTGSVPVSPNALTQVNEALLDKSFDVSPSRRKQSQTTGFVPVRPNVLTQMNTKLLVNKDNEEIEFDENNANLAAEETQLNININGGRNKNIRVKKNKVLQKICEEKIGNIEAEETQVNMNLYNLSSHSITNNEFKKSNADIAEAETEPYIPLIEQLNRNVDSDSTDVEDETKMAKIQGLDNSKNTSSNNNVALNKNKISTRKTLEMDESSNESDSLLAAMPLENNSIEALVQQPASTDKKKNSSCQEKSLSVVRENKCEDVLNPSRHIEDDNLKKTDDLTMTKSTIAVADMDVCSTVDDNIHTSSLSVSNSSRKTKTNIVSEARVTSFKTSNEAKSAVASRSLFKENENSVPVSKGGKSKTVKATTLRETLNKDDEANEEVFDKSFILNKPCSSSTPFKTNDNHNLFKTPPKRKFTPCKTDENPPLPAVEELLTVADKMPERRHRSPIDSEKMGKDCLPLALTRTPRAKKLFKKKAEGFNIKPNTRRGSKIHSPDMKNKFQLERENMLADERGVPKGNKNSITDSKHRGNDQPKDHSKKLKLKHLSVKIERHIELTVNTNVTTDIEPIKQSSVSESITDNLRNQDMPESKHVKVITEENSKEDVTEVMALEKIIINTKFKDNPSSKTVLPINGSKNMNSKNDKELKSDSLLKRNKCLQEQSCLVINNEKNEIISVCERSRRHKKELDGPGQNENIEQSPSKRAKIKKIQSVEKEEFNVQKNIEQISTGSNKNYKYTGRNNISDIQDKNQANFIKSTISKSIKSTSFNEEGSPESVSSKGSPRKSITPSKNVSNERNQKKSFNKSESDKVYVAKMLQQEDEPARKSRRIAQNIQSTRGNSASAEKNESNNRIRNQGKSNEITELENITRKDKTSQNEKTVPNDDVNDVKLKITKRGKSYTSEKTSAVLETKAKMQNESRPEENESYKLENNISSKKHGRSNSRAQNKKLEDVSNHDPLNKLTTSRTRNKRKLEDNSLEEVCNSKNSRFTLHDQCNENPSVENLSVQTRKEKKKSSDSVVVSVGRPTRAKSAQLHEREVNTISDSSAGELSSISSRRGKNSGVSSSLESIASKDSKEEMKKSTVLGDCTFVVPLHSISNKNAKQNENLTMIVEGSNRKDRYNFKTMSTDTDKKSQSRSVRQSSCKNLKQTDDITIVEDLVIKDSSGSKSKDKRSQSRSGSQSSCKSSKQTEDITIAEGLKKKDRSRSKIKSTDRSTDEKSRSRSGSQSSMKNESSLFHSPRRSIKRGEQVLFTGLSNPILESQIKKLGGSVVDCPASCSVLVTDKVRRTVKFLCTLAQAKPIVPPEWITQSWHCSHFLDPMDHLLSDSEAEQKFAFHLPQTLQATKNQPLLAGYSIYTTPSVKPPPEDIKSIVESCGGVFLSKVPSKWPEQTVVISHPDDKPLWKKLKVKGSAPPVVAAEMLLLGILRHQVDLNGHRIT